MMWMAAVAIALAVVVMRTTTITMMMVMVVSGSGSGLSGRGRGSGCGSRRFRGRRRCRGGLSGSVPIIRPIVTRHDRDGNIGSHSLAGCCNHSDALLDARRNTGDEGRAGNGVSAEWAENVEEDTRVVSLVKLRA